jgi:hypothetical protein
MTAELQANCNSLNNPCDTAGRTTRAETAGGRQATGPSCGVSSRENVMDNLFEDTIKEMRVLSASLRRRAHKVDAALEIMLGEDSCSAPPQTGDRTRPDNSHARIPARGIACHTIEMMSFLIDMGVAPLGAIRAYLGTFGTGHDVTLRSQLSSFVAKGWLVRVSRGFYRATPLGASQCGLIYEDHRG